MRFTYVISYSTRITSLWILFTLISEILYLKSSLTVIMVSISNDESSPNTSIHLTNLGLDRSRFSTSDKDLIVLYLIKYSIADKERFNPTLDLLITIFMVLCLMVVKESEERFELSQYSFADYSLNQFGYSLLFK